MRSDLDHLPEGKRAELDRVTAILFDGFEAAKASRSHAHLKNGRILKVILFGSYARGDWVADPVGGYYSDYDLLVVVDHEALTDVVEYWAAADDQLMRERLVAKRLSAPVNFIVHSLADVNAQLRKGRPFFLDVLRDGIALYEAEGFEFAKPEPLTPQARLEEAEVYFREWFGSAEDFLAQAVHAIENARLKVAAFELHQTVERLYICLLLVETLYAPKSHRLSFLRSQAERIAPALIEAWPRTKRFEQRAFERLRRAYVEARYSPSYEITGEDLAWLQTRVGVLRDLISADCRRQLEDLRRLAEMSA